MFNRETNSSTGTMGIFAPALTSITTRIVWNHYEPHRAVQSRERHGFQ